MATWAETYELLVYSIGATFVDRYAGANHTKQAMLVIVELEATDEFAYEAETQLLFKIERFYRHILHYKDINEERDLLIYQINEFTERNVGDLTTFVNDDVSWVDGCVPYHWAEASSRSIIDTSDWIVCS